VNTSFFGELLQSITERGRALLDRTRERRESAEERYTSLVELCEELLSGRGEASGVALAREILSHYAELTSGPRIAFFEALAKRFGPDQNSGVKGMQQVAVTQEKGNELGAAGIFDLESSLRCSVSYARLNFGTDPGSTSKNARDRGWTYPGDSS